MSNQAYLPTAEADRIVWLNNLSLKLTVQGLACGLNAAEISAIQLEITFLLWVMQVYCPALQQQAHSAIAYKAMIFNGSGNYKMPLPILPTFANPPAVTYPGVMTRISKLITRIKMSDNYSEAIGRDLGIIGTASTAEYAVPELWATVEQGNGCQRVSLSYTKHKHDGVHIESRRNDGDWEFLAACTIKPYLDERPLLVANTPEHREYRVRWMDKDQPHGEYSAVQRVTVGM